MAASTSPAMPAQPSMGGAMMMDKPKYGGTLYMAVRADPRGGFEAHTPGGRREARQAIGAVYERVAAWDSLPGDACSQVLVPWAAESWEYTDPTTIDIKLRQGVKFHDIPPVNGRELVADDVVFSFKRMFERGLQVRTGEAISSIEAPDNYTVRIKTHEPFPLAAFRLLRQVRGRLHGPGGRAPGERLCRLGVHDRHRRLRPHAVHPGCRSQGRTKPRLLERGAPLRRRLRAAHNAGQECPDRRSGSGQA